MSGKVVGLAETIKKLSAQELTKATQQAMAKYAVKVDRDAKRRCPVDMGVLRSSIYFQGTKSGVVFGASAEYAAYVEFGTGPYAAALLPNYDDDWQAFAAQFKTANPGNTPAQPFLYPAITQNLNTFEEELAKILSQI